MKKVLFVATVVKKHINVFHVPFLKMFKDDGWETSVAARNDFDENEECKTDYCDNYFDIPFCRNPLSFGNVKAYRYLKKLIDDNEYDIIHCHTPVGGLLARLAAINARKKGTRVIYTAHGFHFYNGAPLANWLFFYPAERFLSKFTDTLITINQEDYKFARNKMNAKEIKYVPGVGIDIDKFFIPNFDKKSKRKELGVPDDGVVIISIGELNKNKNHEIIVKALSKIKDNNIHYIIAGKGEKKEYLEDLAVSLGVNLHLIGYRMDIIELLNASDIFAFPSYREGLSLSLMEAMASGLPCIGLNIRGNNDLIRNGENGYLVAENDAEQYVGVIKALLKSRRNCETMGDNAKSSLKPFSKNNVYKEMYSIYFG